ncbi:hypothetical protein [Mesorhizobium sp. M7A.F.Ca.US.008.03.1.1]|uniref:hypothetical protein n=1 Tax=Mesorhizobium sp. M7A.F.Ca.US.008.03.1.1 TaxID=2496742 RepID=UPI001FE15417|nr:hypothetical protein [Mesorhizobium sp. M7A.F.Ca.US.008.03.1.1]
MNFVIEFYRSRDTDEATLDKVSLEAPNLRAALQGTTALFHTLAMPQIPIACAFVTTPAASFTPARPTGRIRHHDRQRELQSSRAAFADLIMSCGYRSAPQHGPSPTTR